MFARRHGWMIRHSQVVCALSIFLFTFESVGVPLHGMPASSSSGRIAYAPSGPLTSSQLDLEKRIRERTEKLVKEINRTGRRVAEMHDPALRQAWQRAQNLRAKADVAAADDFRPILGPGYQVDFPEGGFRITLPDPQGDRARSKKRSNPGPAPITSLATNPFDAMPQLPGMPNLDVFGMPQGVMPQGFNLPGFDVSGSAGGVPEIPGSEQDASGPSLEFRLSKVGRSVACYDRMNAKDDRPRREGGVTFFRRGDALTEMYENRGSGVEQSFYIPAKPAGEGDLVLEGDLKTTLEPLAPASGEGGVLFEDPATHLPVLRFGAVTVMDSEGRKIGAPVHVKGGKLTIRVPNAWLAKAVFPVLIDPLIGPQFQASLDPRDERNAGIAHDDVHNRYLVVFERRISGSNRDVYGQLLNADGTRFGAPFGIAVTGDDERFPKVAFSSAAQRFMVVWEREGKDVQARLINSDLTPVAPAFFVDNLRTGKSQEPDVAWRSAGDRFCVVWIETGNPGPGRDIFGELLDSSGATLADDVMLRNANAQIHNPDVVYNAKDDAFFMVYDSDGSRNLYGFGFDGSLGGLTTPVVTISAAPHRQELGALAWNSDDNEYLAVYESDERASGDDDIRGQRIAPNGTLVGPVIHVAEQARDEQEPDVAYSPTCHSYMAVWGWKTADGDWDVMGQEIEAGGALAGSAFQVSQSPDPSSNEFVPAIAFNFNDGAFACVWEDGRSGNFDIWGQLLDHLCAPNTPQAPIHNASDMGGDGGPPPVPPPTAGAMAVPVEMKGGGSVTANGGRFQYSVNVVTLPANCPPISLAIHYDSAVLRDGDMGVGWTHTYEGTVQSTGAPGASDAILFGPTGRVDVYTFSAGAYQSPLGFYNVLIYNAGQNRFELLDAHGGRAYFGKQIGANFRLTELQDRHENTLTLNYNVADQLDNIVDTRGMSVTFSHAPDGHISKMTDFTGREYRFVQDANRDLIQAITPATAEFPGGKTMQFGYLSGQAQAWMNHNLITIRDYKNQLFLVNTYQATTDRVIQQRYGDAGQDYHFVYQPGQATEIDRLGFSTVYTLNAQGCAVDIQDQESYHFVRQFNSDMELTRQVSPRGNSANYVFDSANADVRAHGNILQWRMSDEALGAAPDITAGATYEPTFNFMKTFTNTRGFVTNYTFDYESGGPIHGDVVDALLPTVTLGQPTPQVVHLHWTYDPEGHPTSFLDGEGNLTVWEYFAHPDLRACFPKAVTVASGVLNLRTEFDWSPVGNLLHVKDPRGNEWAFTVNELNQTTRVTAPAPLPYTVDRHFDANGNVDRVDVANIDENGAPYPNSAISRTSTFDTLDNLATVTQEIDAGTNATTVFQRDAEENITLVTLPEGNLVKTVWTSRGLPQSVTRGFGSPDAATVGYSFNGNQYLTEILNGEGGTHHVVFTPDGFDRTVRTTDGVGNHRDIAYNENSTPIAMSTAGVGGGILEQSTVFVDELERVYQVDRLFQNSTGGAVGDGIARTQILHDRNSFVTRVTDDNGHATTIYPDAANRWVRMVDAAGDEVVRQLDPNGNATLVTVTETNQATSLVETTVVSAQFDVLNRPTLITRDPGGLSLPTQLGYDSRGNNVKTVDAESKTARMEFDGRNLPLATTCDVGGLNTAVGSVWDRNGRMTSSRDANGNVTFTDYNQRDLPFRMRYTDATSKTISWTRDDRPLQIVDQNGTVVVNAYDDADSLVGRTITPAPGVLGATQETYVVDGLYRTISATNQDGGGPISACAWGYNTLGIVDRETQTIGAGPTKNLGCAYDGAGNMKAAAYPSGFNLTMSHDAVDRLTQIQQGANTLAQFKYVGGREAERTYANGIKMARAYDAVRRTTEIKYTDAASNVKADFTYGYDRVDNRTFENRVHDGVADVYRLDGIYQVSGVKYGVPSGDISPSNTYADYATFARQHQYALDQAGNRESVDRDGVVEHYNSPGGTYTPDPMNEYRSIESEQLNYDANGNLIEDGQFFYAYDYRNSLVKVTRKSDSAVVASKFDAAGRRVERANAGGVMRHYYFGQQIWETRTGSDQLVERHVWGNGIDELLMSDLGPFQNRFYFCQNTLGSNVLATGNFGQVVEEYVYTDVYGASQAFFCNDSGATRTRTPITNSVIGNRYLFTGRELDQETGNYHYRARAYSPRMGRFLQRDPIQADSLDNSYRYAANFPARSVDPFGLRDFPDTTTVNCPPPKTTTVSGANPLVDPNDQSHTEGSGDSGDEDELEDQLAGGVGPAVVILPFAVIVIVVQTRRKTQAIARLADTVAAITEKQRQAADLEDVKKAARKFGMTEAEINQVLGNPVMVSGGQPNPTPNDLLREAIEAKAKREPDKLQFGQRRISGVFQSGDKVPYYVRGKDIFEVAKQLRAGEGGLGPDAFPIKFFIDYATGTAVAINNRSLATLAEANIKPTNLILVIPTYDEYARLWEIPYPGFTLPGPRIPVTSPGRNPRVVTLPWSEGR